MAEAECVFCINAPKVHLVSSQIYSSPEAIQSHNSGKYKEAYFYIALYTTPSHDL